ncbi:MAG: DUF3971 domain-containing protein, partial [Gammaproteobacteria bacterium]|nr:DUF3971 domain-containing protein [Gammaproteobacteria bacterium]
MQSASADIDFSDIAMPGQDAFALSGHLEFRNDADGWLAAANRMRLQTQRGAWPEASLRVEAGTGSDGRIIMLDVRASYLNLVDTDVIKPWLTVEQDELLASYAPDGEIRNLVAALSNVDTEAPRFDVSADFFDVGIAVVNARPGVRGFTGRLRADRSGGRLEINSSGLTLNAPGVLGVPAILDDATGTVIWRRSGTRTTVLSDSILMRNADFELETNVEITLDDDGGAPIVDLAGTWSVSDLAIAKRYIPFIPRIPKTSEWFQEGLIAGRVPRGTVRLYGPMDKFPFDNGEGRLLIEANVRDARIMYQRRWPVAEIIDFDFTVENTRLYSRRNHIINVGNEVTNAHIEIADFRQPVLTIKGYSAGALDSLRQLMAQSPIGTDVFAGNLDRVAVSGNGSFSLDLSVPVRDWRSFEFTSRLQTDNAILRLDGFPAPITDLSGSISIQREDISSESLVGTFLGQPVSIILLPAPESMPGYRVIAYARGAATAGALTAELGLPLDGMIAGRTDYAARLLFPRGNVEAPSPFAIEIETDLVGLALELPAPLHKLPEQAAPIAARIEMPKGEMSIKTTGTAEDLMSWRVNFAKVVDKWDLDRGIVTLGGEVTTEVADTRGLHLRGRTDYVRMQDWFDLSSRQDKQIGMAERIRSIDMKVGNLHIIGQHLVDHHVRLDRSSRDWLIEIDGEDVRGSVVVPYDFRSGRTLSVDMDRLVLPGEEDE